MNKTSMKMTAASPSRRRRFIRQALDQPVSLTPKRVQILTDMASFRVISLPQLARLEELSEKAARKHVRPLFDAGLIEVTSVSRAALADPGAANDPSLLSGSAPNLLRLSHAGSRLLFEHGLIEQVKALPPLGPRSSLFLAHTLAVGDVKIWLLRTARTQADYSLQRWQEAAEATIDLKRSQPPKRVLPDAWFVLHIGEAVLVGLVEVDRGTERGETRWRQKLVAYKALFAGDQLRQTTGYRNARLLVITPTVKRRDQLADLIARQSDSSLHSKVWLADRSVLDTTDLTGVGWRQPASQILKALVPANLLSQPSS